ncbi:MAG: tRNA-queuosine alpha-mannosyltransferase domain-containing protein, partial [Planctomycetota bacterium]
AFLDGWIERSRHEWTLLTLPPTKWKWRMRHAAITLSDLAARRADQDGPWDLIICSDMLNLAEFLGLSPEPVRSLPTLAYFHENQVTYPVRRESEFDYHFVFTNLTTSLAARQVWFNSAFHMESFLGGLEKFLRRMPDNRPLGELDLIRDKSLVRPPGIEPFPTRGDRRPGPLRILWAARWEFDKAPEALFEALDRISARNVPFEISVIGGRTGPDTPAIFAQAREKYASNISHWGFLDSINTYRAALSEADVIVSTALHEFFGMSVVEAVAAGAFPLVPRRLAYPEVLGPAEEEATSSFFYEDGGEDLPRRLEVLSRSLEEDGPWGEDRERGIRAVAKYSWDRLVPGWDEEMEAMGLAHG